MIDKVHKQDLAAQVARAHHFWLGGGRTELVVSFWGWGLLGSGIQGAWEQCGRLGWLVQLLLEVWLPVT